MVKAKKRKVKRSKQDKTYVAYLITWTESERGWGQRPDGASLHLSQGDVKTYIEKYCKTLPAAVPDVYSRPDSDTGKMVAVSPSLHKKLASNRKKDIYGMMLWQSEFREALNTKEIQQ